MLKDWLKTLRFWLVCPTKSVQLVTRNFALVMTLAVKIVELKWLNEE
jgi:hypothetical protein